MIICKICKCEKSSHRSLIYHIKKEHAILSIKEYSQKYENTKIKYCKYCGNEASFNTKTHTYREVCINKTCICKHANVISNRSLQKKYGVDNISQIPGSRDKMKSTKFERYGNTSYNNIEKNKRTCLERYGVDNGSKTQQAKQKISDKYYVSNKIKRKEKTIITLQEKYNVTWNSKNKEIHDKQIKSLIEFRNKEIIYRIDQMNMIILHNDNNKKFTLECKFCKSVFENVLRPYINFKYTQNKKLCEKCYPKEKFRSNIEMDFAAEINKIYNGKIELNKKIFGYEADVYIPDKNLVFEFNGLYWHSELFKEPNYHKDKKIKFASHNINLINIWEDDWNDERKKKIIFYRIKSLLHLNQTIYARNCELKEINVQEAKEFVNLNHLMGYINSLIKIGLYYKNELISIVLIGKRNIGGKKGEYEILRSCYKGNINVVGGLGKMIKYFLRKYHSYLYSYADCDWSDLNNNSYDKIGFKLVRHTTPSYFWVINGQRQNRINFQKYKLIKLGADINKSEDEIMHENGYYKIYNAGNLLYEYTII